MKILHLPFTFYPDAVGGTEVYVLALSHGLERLGFRSVVAAPGSYDSAYEVQGIRVCRYAVGGHPAGIRDLYGMGDRDAAAGFERILASENPDVVHLHALTRGVSLRIVRLAKQYGLPIVFTYHTPTVSCQRGTMMRGGLDKCDGQMNVHTCARCTLEKLFRGSTQWRSCGRRSARALAALVGTLPTALGTSLGRLNLQGGRWTALRMTELVQLRHETVRSFLTEVDHVVAVCEWVKDVLIRNGVEAQRITLCRQGITDDDNTPAQAPIRTAFKPLKVVYIGRLVPTKGVHILIRAFQLAPQLGATLAVYGVAQDLASNKYEQELRRAASSDDRISFHPPIPNADVVSTLQMYDVLAAPSQWLETGPLVVLEAFAARVPVIGSRLGGIIELVRDGLDGILLNHNNANDWAKVLHRLADHPNTLARFRENIFPPRRMSSVAKEMGELYTKQLRTHLRKRSFMSTSFSTRSEPLRIVQ